MPNKKSKSVTTQTDVDEKPVEHVLNEENVLQYHVTDTDNTNSMDNTTFVQNNEHGSPTCAMQFHNMLRAKFAHLKTQCLVDTGASINVISDKFLSQIPSKLVTKLPTKITTIYGVGEYTTTVKCMVRLDFEINGSKFTENFYALPNGYNIILGLPFITHNNALLDISNAEISLNGTTFQLYTPARRSTIAKTVHNEIIEPYTVSEIKIKLSKPVVTPMMFLTGISSTDRKYPGLTIVEAVIDSQVTRCRLVNKSEFPVVISANSPICIARTIHEHEITEFIDLFEPCDDDPEEINTTKPHTDNSNSEPNNMHGTPNISNLCMQCHESQSKLLSPALQNSNRSDSGMVSATASLNRGLSSDCPSSSRRMLAPLTQDDLDSTADCSMHAHQNTHQKDCFTDPQNQKDCFTEPQNQKDCFTEPPNIFSGPTQAINMDSQNIIQNGNNSNKTNVNESNHINHNTNETKKSKYKCRKLNNTNDKNDSQSNSCNADQSDNADPFDKKLEFEITNDNFETDEKDDFKQFLMKNHKVFATSRKNMGYNTKFPHITDTGDGRSVGTRYFRMSAKMKAIMDNEIQDLLENGFIEESTSQWRSPAILVRKQTPTGEPSYRLVCDYRKLNKLSVPQHFPMITVEEVWEMVGRVKPKIFSSLDLMSGFQQLKMDDETKHKASFVVQGKQYQWNRMPFGLRNAPITFQRTMAHVLKDVLFKTVILYVDDILVMSDCIECHKKHLQEVFDRLAEANLTLKASKCKFAVEEIQYLGHVLTPSGVKANPQKIQIIKDYKIPQNEKQVRQFLGLSQYYKRFQKDFSKIAKPLYDLTKKDTAWNWTPECQKSFEILKNNLITEPVLAYPDNTKPYIICSDASTYGLGYILMQKDDDGNEKVISYSGRALRKSEKNYTISELEALAVVSAFKQFHPYVYGNFTTVRTDHSALKYIQNPNTKAVGKIARWMLELQNYDFVIEYKSGKSNSAADALSRLPEYPQSTKNQAEIPGDANVMTTNMAANASPQMSDHSLTYQPLEKFDWLEAPLLDDIDIEHTPQYCFDIRDIDIKFEQQNCEEIGPWYQFIKTGIVPPGVEYSKPYLATADQYAIKDGILVHLYQARTRNIHQYHPIITQIVVPKKLRARILSDFHESLSAGAHQAFDRTYQAIRQRFYWRGMYSDIYEYQKSCINCQRASNQKPPKPPLQPLPIVGLFERISLDFIGPLRESKSKKRWILLVVDSFSGWCETFAMEHADAISTAKVLYSEILTRYGAPRYILTDRGANFLSSLVHALCDIFSIKRRHTSSYHPQSNGRCERFNRFINKSLRTMVNESQEDWPLILPAIMMAYRCTPATHSTEVSPYFICFGKEMLTPIETAINPNITEVSPNYRETLKLFIDNIKIARQVAAENLQRHQEYNKMYYDQNAEPLKYKLGDLVWLWDPTTPVGYSKKLKARWVGPYRISQIGDHNTYRLRHYRTDLPTDTLINAQRLKPARLPWESRIRRDDPRNQRVNVPQNQQIAGQQQPQHGNTGTKVNKQAGTGRQYQNTRQGEIQAPRPAGKDTQIPQLKQRKVIKVMNLKRQNQENWFKVKFDNDKQTYWLKEGTIDIPQHLIDECLKVRTWQGKLRKRRKR